MIINVLGLGSTIEQYEPDGNITIGVNDICKHHTPDYLVLQDPPHAFGFERYGKIIGTPPKKLVFSQLDSWRDSFDNFCKLELLPFKLNHINSDGFLHKWVMPSSIDSTFLATVLAYRLGAKQVNLFGADFSGHPAHKNNLSKITDNYYLLAHHLKAKGVTITAPKQSALKVVKNIITRD